MSCVINGQGQEKKQHRIYVYMVTLFFGGISPTYALELSGKGHKYYGCINIFVFGLALTGTLSVRAYYFMCHKKYKTKRY